MPLNDLPCAALDSSSVENALSGMSLICCSRSRLHCATSGRRALIRIWEQFGNNSAQTPGKTGERGRPESRTNQQDRHPGPVCKTSIPGSNPGGASKFKKNALPRRIVRPPSVAIRVVRADLELSRDSAQRASDRRPWAAKREAPMVLMPEPVGGDKIAE
jgi:hypothetical protein